MKCLKSNFDFRSRSGVVMVTGEVEGWDGGGVCQCMEILDEKMVGRLTGWVLSHSRTCGGRGSERFRLGNSK